MIQNTILSKIKFIRELAERAVVSLQLKERVRLRKKAMMEEEKAAGANSAKIEMERDSEDEDVLEYPDECRVLDIMRGKYFDAIQFFYDSEDKKQLPLAIKEFQKFSYLYEKMAKYLDFDPAEIEEDVYIRLDDELKKTLANPKIIREMNAIRIKRAARILEDEDVNILNFQMFQYAMKLFKKEKKAKLRAEEEKQKAEEERLNPGGKVR